MRKNFLKIALSVLSVSALFMSSCTKVNVLKNDNVVVTIGADQDAALIGTINDCNDQNGYTFTAGKLNLQGHVVANDNAINGEITLTGSGLKLVDFNQATYDGSLNLKVVVTSQAFEVDPTSKAKLATVTAHVKLLLTSPGDGRIKELGGDILLHVVIKADGSSTAEVLKIAGFNCFI